MSEAVKTVLLTLGAIALFIAGLALVRILMGFWQI